MNKSQAKSSKSKSVPVKTARDIDEMPIPRLSVLPVVSDQKQKFETDLLLRKLSGTNTIRYTGNIKQSQQQRQVSFNTECCNGNVSIAFIQHGITFQLVFGQKSSTSSDGCDFTKQPGRVHIITPMLMNGVCLKFRGWLDMQTLDGIGCLEFDEERALIEHQKLCDYGKKRTQAEIEHEFKRKLHAIAREWGTLDHRNDITSSSDDLWRPWEHGNHGVDESMQ